MTVCQKCGRRGARMVPIRNRWVKRIDGYRCSNPVACSRRQQQLGQWVGSRVVRRRDSDGTAWTIRRYDDLGLRGMAAGPWTSGFVLICEYREHRMTSNHPSIAAAQAHRDDLVASWVARSLRSYARERVDGT